MNQEKLNGVGILKKDETNLNKEHLLQNIINSSTYLLSLEDDWDGQGGIAVKQGTFDRAIDILKNIDWNMFEQFSPLNINPPTISAGISSGITIQWNFINFSAIIFIDEDESKDTTYSILTNDCNNVSSGKYYAELFISLIKTYYYNKNK